MRSQATVALRAWQLQPFHLPSDSERRLNGCELDRTWTPLRGAKLQTLEMMAMSPERMPWWLAHVKTHWHAASSDHEGLHEHLRR